MRVASTVVLIMALAAETTFAQIRPSIPPRTAPLSVPIPLQSRPLIRPTKLSCRVQ
jgi:hypothetical protein